VNHVWRHNRARFLTLSLLSYFIKQAIQVPRDVRLSVNYGLNRVRSPLPFAQARKFARASHFNL